MYAALRGCVRDNCKTSEYRQGKGVLLFEQHLTLGEFDCVADVPTRHEDVWWREQVQIRELLTTPLTLQLTGDSKLDPSSP